MRVLLAGGSGTIGRALRRELAASGAQVSALVRGAVSQPGDFAWTGRVGSVPPAAIELADAVVSLNGAPLARLPWTAGRRDAIMASRVDATAALARAILEAERPPAVWVSASAAGYYGTGPRPGRPPASSPSPAAEPLMAAAAHLTEAAAPPTGGSAPLTEATGHLTEAAGPPTDVTGLLTEASAPGAGFLAAVTRAWEAAAVPAAARTRLVRARTGVVLGPEGLLIQLRPLARLGLAPQMGGGKQWWPWISLRDEVRAIAFALRAEPLTGPVNLVGPTLATAGEIAQALASAVGHRVQLPVPVPAGLLRAVLGPAADELICASQPAVPAALQAAGFEFLDQTPAQAIAWALTAS